MTTITVNNTTYEVAPINYGLFVVEVRRWFYATDSGISGWDHEGVEYLVGGPWPSQEAAQDALAYHLRRIAA